MPSYTASYLVELGLLCSDAVTHSQADDNKHPDLQSRSCNGDQSDNFMEALKEALQSALTKFDSLEAQFAGGRSVKEVATMLLEEIADDKDFTGQLKHSDQEELLRSFVQTTVGKAFGAWKAAGKERGHQPTKTKKVRTVPLPWSSIDAFPEWVMGQIALYTDAESENKGNARKDLEHALLERPVASATIKYDGTCFGKMHSGDLCGRKEMLGALCTEYQCTSTGSAASCDVTALKSALELVLEGSLQEVCVWGELMCNPRYYSYTARGLAEKWLCFGVVVAFNQPCAPLASRLQKHGFVHSLSEDRSSAQRHSARLLMCPALRVLLQQCGAANVADDMFHGKTMAEVVACGAENLQAGENEGIVIAFQRANGQASLRKWKNSAEGGTARRREALLLRECHAMCLALVEQDKLDVRIAEMVETLQAVAGAETSPMKKGRDKRQKSKT